jgi:hypothetical protein
MLFWLLACVGGGPETGMPPGDTGGSDPPLVVSDGTRVLLHSGNQGHPAEGSGVGSFSLLDSFVTEELGYNLDERSVWPENLHEYRLIGLVGPGSTGPSEFSPDDVATLQAALDQGSRLAIFGDSAMCADAGVAQLLADLGSTLRFTGEGADENQVIGVDSTHPDHAIVDGLSDLTMRSPCWIDPGLGDRLLLDVDRNILAAVDRPGWGGDVVLIGDFELFDDSGSLGDGDHKALFANLTALGDSVLQDSVHQDSGAVD